MTGQMNESYFAEKKDLALESIQSAMIVASDATAAIGASTYAMPNLTSPDDVHSLLKEAADRLQAARRYFETARWAAAHTDLQFDDWVREQGHPELALR